MSVTWKCDLCGKETHVNPKQQPELDEKGKQKTEVVKRQDPRTGDMIDITQPSFKDLEPRTYIVRVNCGADSIQKDFCKECLNEVLPEINALFSRLAKIKSK